MSILTNLLGIFGEHGEKSNDDEYISADYLFSYWLLVWFIIYYIFTNIFHYGGVGGKLIFFNYLSPIIGMWIAFLYSFAEFLYLLFSRNIVITLKYSFMILCIKLIPLYLMRNKKIQFVQDTLALIFVFILYNIYLYVNNTNLVEVYNKTEDAINSGQIKTPFFHFLDYVYNYFVGGGYWTLKLFK